MSEPVADPRESVEPADRASGYAWYGLGILVLVYILNFVDRQILSILANDIKRDLDLTDADLGFLYGTAFGVFYSLFGIPLGRLADNWHRIRLMTLGLALWSAMTAISGLSRNGMQLSMARIGVGIGEATASPAAYSLISDWFPKRLRATALAIYSSGLYLGGGLSLFIGGAIVKNWNEAYPDGGPLGLVGWQAAFMAVGIPGLLLALLVFTLREPVRGASEGVVTPVADRPFAVFGRELMAILPPLTLIAAARRGRAALATNVAVGAIIAAAAFGLIIVTGAVPQWIALGIGFYAVFSWASALRAADSAAFGLIWGSRAFVATVVGYSMVAFASYAVSFWAAPYAERMLGQAKDVAGWWIGGPGALGGFLGVIIGGAISDRLRQRLVQGRLVVVLFGLLAPVIPLIIAFTTDNILLFYVLNFLLSLFASSALGAAAATTQDLVLPRMRGTATATFFIGTTMLGLALGPYLAGQVSHMTGDNLSVGVLSILVAAPVGLVALLIAWRALPNAEAKVRALVERSG